MISKYAPKREKKLIKMSEVEEPMAYIDNSNGYYITPSGKVYRQYNDKLFPRKPYYNKRSGYLYITIVMLSGKKQSFRLHRLVAKAFIPNPFNLQIVGHKDNNKINVVASNLYWTNNQENVQKAVDDGLLMNDKGYNDSQSHPVICYDKNFNEIAKFGSISECHKAIGVSKSTITRHCKNQIKTKTRKGYYFRYQSV